MEDVNYIVLTSLLHLILMGGLLILAIVFIYLLATMGENFYEFITIVID